MFMDEIWVIFLPFAGTVLGATFVFFIKGEMTARLDQILSGFAAGVMVAASVFSLLLPAIDSSEDLGAFAAIPAIMGIGLGFLLLILTDRLSIRLSKQAREEEKHRLFLLVLSVTIHNLPEGMAVGVALAAFLAGEAEVSLLSAITLALGIAIQNIPEGAIVSLPMAAGGSGRGRAFGIGALSGIVEPLGALLPLLAISAVVPVMPYLLGLAAGAMLSVVVTELIPHMADKEGSLGALAFAVGFSFMTFLDTALS